MKLPRIIFAFLFCVAACGFAMPRFSAGANSQDRQMVFLHVRVIDPTNKPVRDVPQTAFQVTEDGVPQKIEFFTSEDVPLTYGLVIDCSGSMRTQLELVVRAGINIVNSNTPDDETFVIRFISSDKIEKLQELTSDKQVLRNGLESLYVEGGQTAVVDAIYLSADYLAQQKIDPGKVRRRALILVSDGEDRNSFYKKEQLFAFLAAKDTQIYTIGLPSELKGKKREDAILFLSKLATDTGGRTFFPTSPNEIASISNEIIRDIRTQYVIGYVPSNGDSAKGFHKTVVSISDDPNREKRVAVTRVGYSTQK
jgi:Ca-activated chloride channel family protein